MQVQYIFAQRMAPTPSDPPIPEQRPPSVRKHILAASLASTDNIDAGAIKRRKLEEAAAALRKQPSVEVLVNNDELTSNPNLQPRNTSRILEVADGSDDDDVDSEKAGDDFDDIRHVSGLEPEPSECASGGEDDDEEEDEEDEETDEAELCESSIYFE